MNEFVCRRVVLLTNNKALKPISQQMNEKNDRIDYKRHIFFQHTTPLQLCYTLDRCRFNEIKYTTYPSFWHTSKKDVGCQQILFLFCVDYAHRLIYILCKQLHRGATLTCGATGKDTREVS